MKTAIVFYSMSGNTEYVANKISEKIDADIIRVVPQKAYPDSGFKKFLWGGKSAVMGEEPELEEYVFDSEKYDQIILGTPVWASTFTPPIRTFIKENKEKLKGKKIAVFVCLSGAGSQKTIEKLKQFLQIENFEAELVLIDPKEKMLEENDKKIENFCNLLK